MFYLFLAKQFIRTQWRSQNEYRFSFIMGILAQGTNFVFRYLALYLLVSRFGSLIGVTLNLWGILWLVITLVSGGIISGCVFLISSLPSVVAIGNVSLKNITYVFKDVVQYPLSIFGTPLQIILTVFIPLGFTTFYPLQPLLGKQDMGIFPVFIQYLSPLVAIVMVLLLLLAWRTVINKYESTGT